MKGKATHCQSMSLGSAGIIKTSLKVLTPRTRRRINLEVMGLVQTNAVFPALGDTLHQSPRLATTRRDLCGSSGAYWKRGKLTQIRPTRDLSSPLTNSTQWQRSMGKSVLLRPHPLRLRVKETSRVTFPSLRDEKPSPWTPEEETHR